MSRYSIVVLWIFFIQASSANYTVIQNPSSLTVHEGGFTNINCSFTSGTERLAASAEFYRMPDDSNPLKNSSDGRIILTSTDNSLIMTIGKASPCDSGTYICKVKFFYGLPYKGDGSILNVIAASPHQPSGTGEILSKPQTIVEWIRISLLAALVILSLILLCKFW